MNRNLLKFLLIGCALLIIILIKLATHMTVSTEDENDYTMIKVTQINDKVTFDEDELDYNHLTAEQAEFISDTYAGMATITDRGVEVYLEKIGYGEPYKTITSEWPNKEIAKLIPEPDFGKRTKIEYAENWMNIFLKDVSNGDCKRYAKKLKEEGFKNEIKTINSSNLWRTILQDDNQNEVTISYIKSNDSCTIGIKIGGKS